VLIALISWRILIVGVADATPFMMHHLEARSLFLYSHLFFGPVALAILPFQLAAGIRRKAPMVHRWLGRVYAAAVLLSGLPSFALAFNTSAVPIAAAGFATLGVLWIIVTAQAVRLAMRREFAGHRAWMIRSAAMTFAGVTLRIYLGIAAGLVGFETQAQFHITYQIVAWLAWVPNVIIAEWIIRRGRAR